MVILYKVFAPLVQEWQAILYWVIIASITLANIFAIRQQNLKRFFAYSSISQAGYIMLGVISGTADGYDRTGVLRAGVHAIQPSRLRGYRCRGTSLRQDHD